MVAVYGDDEECHDDRGDFLGDLVGEGHTLFK